MGRSVNSSSKASQTVLSLPLGGIASVFRGGNNYKPVGAVLLRAAYPDLSAQYPVTGQGMYSSLSATGGSGTVKAICYGNGKFVCVGPSGAINVSTDGRTFNAVIAPALAGVNFVAVAFGNGVFVALTTNGGVATSADGITWALAGTPSQDFTSITYGAGLFVATVGSAGGTAVAVCYTSPDGVTWTSRTMPSSQTWACVTYDGTSKFVAVAFGPTTAAATSPDGITWTARTMPSSQNWSAVGWGNGLFVAVAGITGTATTVTASSADGITWAAHTLPASHVWCTVAYGNGFFMVGASDVPATAISTDGLNWATQGTASSICNNQLCYGAGQFLSAGLGGTQSSTYVEGATSPYIYLSGTVGNFIRVL